MDWDVQAGINRCRRIGSVSGLLVILVALCIIFIFIGVRESLHPAIGAAGFGVPLHEPHDADLLPVKAVRDVESGKLALTFLNLRNREFLVCALAVLTLMPLLDGLAVFFRHAGWTFHACAVGSLGNSCFHAGDRRVA